MFSSLVNDQTVLLDPYMRLFQALQHQRQNGPARKVNERIPHILQINRMGMSPSDGVESYSDHSLEVFTPPEMLPAYSTTPIVRTENI